MNLIEGEERIMKLRNKIAAITTAAMLAFTGVGFAAWTFNNSESASVVPTGYVTSAMDLTNLEVTAPTEDLYIVFDQDHPYWSIDTIRAGHKPAEYTGGLTLVASLEGEDQSDGAHWTGSFTQCAFDGTNLASYLTFGALATPADVNILPTDTSKTFNIVLPTLSYKDNKPATKAAYDTMLSAVDGTTVTFSFTFEIAEVVA